MFHFNFLNNAFYSLSKFLSRSWVIFIIKGIKTIVFILIVVIFIDY